MNSDKCISLISEKLEINKKLAEKLYEKYWIFIADKLSKDGIAEINGMGTFSIEEKKEQDKIIYSIKFDADQNFIENVK
jgi:nucleoid DNA-binding protein